MKTLDIVTQTAHYEDYDDALALVKSKEGSYMPPHFIKVLTTPLTELQSVQLFKEFQKKKSYSQDYVYAVPTISFNHPLISDFDMGSRTIDFSEYFKNELITQKTFHTGVIHDLAAPVIKDYCLKNDLELIRARINVHNPQNIQGMRMHSTPKNYTVREKDQWRARFDNKHYFFDSEQEAINFLENKLSGLEKMIYHFQNSSEIVFLPSTENMKDKTYFMAPDSAEYEITLKAYEKDLTLEITQDSWVFYYEN